MKPFDVYELVLRDLVGIDCLPQTDSSRLRFRFGGLYFRCVERHSRSTMRTFIALLGIEKRFFFFFFSKHGRTEHFPMTTSNFERDVIIIFCAPTRDIVNFYVIQTRIYSIETQGS